MPVDSEIILLALRVVTGGLLLAFFGAVFWVLWRDYQVAVDPLGAGRRRRGRLVVLASEDGIVDIGTNFPLLPVTSVGRSMTNTIVLNDSFCSQEHALVTWRGGQWWLEDRQSRNGTRLNDEPVREAVVLSTGDVIGVGQVELKVELE